MHFVNGIYFPSFVRVSVCLRLYIWVFVCVCLDFMCNVNDRIESQQQKEIEEAFVVLMTSSELRPLRRI